MIRKLELYALLAALLVLAVFSLNWALKGAIHYQKDVLVPDLTGKPLPEALDLTSGANLGLRKDGAESNDGVPAGTVLRQIPSAGAQVREGRIVRVVLSQGGDTVFVPEVIGQSLRTAEIALRSYFLSLGEIRTQPSIKYDKDVVVSQDPAPKTIVGKNSLVHLTVSDGPPKDGTILTPDFIGKNLDAAQAWSGGSGIRLNVLQDPAATAPAGSIVKQDPAADSVLSSGGTVNVTVSANQAGAAAPGTAAERNGMFHFEVPQGGQAKEFAFILVDAVGSREIWHGQLDPGSKHDIPLPAKMGPNARVRVFVDGILTEERSAR